MFNFILRKILGSQSDRIVKKLAPIVEVINGYEAAMQKMTDAELGAKTDEFKKQVLERIAEEKKIYEEALVRLKEAPSAEIRSELEEDVKAASKDLKDAREEILWEILPAAFAVVREAAKRAINMRHFDVQLIGGIILHQGKITEMATGEGKTLVATLPAYLNGLTGDGVHIITVNDYLAKRDRNWMGPVYEFLGLSVGVIQHDMVPQERQLAYSCDITYGTNNEFGFDYLRDNMVVRKEDMVQRRLNYGIVDEVDSILIDEARTPLIISGPTEESTELYYKIDKMARQLKKDTDYKVEEKTQTVSMTEEGIAKSEKMLGVSNLYEDIHMDLVHHINQALKAHELFKLDDDYIVKDGEVIIVDEFTGRLMPGRRYSDGLHQALEAKEGVKIERENQTLATITFQNYFRMYRKLAGMTGTAETEAEEFIKIYNLDVVVIPTNRPLIRYNHADVIYKTENEKFKAVCSEIAKLHEASRPVLVGTTSIEKSERLSQMLKKYHIPHHVLNAKYHEMEAEIIAKAGQPYAVTIATNMAGRGTDIVLGEGIAAKGGLHVVGTERHEARRIDNQLRGRAGRQGDPGSSRFYLSLEDDLLRIFGSDRIAMIMNKLGMAEGEEIQHPFVTKAIETAQKRVEGYNFDIRKHLLEYDNVMNKQREVIYDERKRVLESEDMKSHIFEMIDELLESVLEAYINPELAAHERDYEGLRSWLRSRFAINLDDLKFEQMQFEKSGGILNERIKNAYEEKERALTAGIMRQLERGVLLQIIDSRWKDHLYNMDNLREGIGLRAYGQRDPLVEYQHEGYEMFQDMISRIKEEAVEFLFKVQAVTTERRPVLDLASRTFMHQEVSGFQEAERSREEEQAAVSSGANSPFPSELPQGPSVHHAPYKREMPKVGRNDPCPCGSGKKYKKCCGK